MRPSDWQYGVSVQQEILPRVSIEVGYNRRWLTAFNVVDNALQPSSDFDSFSIAIPNDSRLPAGVAGSTLSSSFSVRN